MKSTFTERNVYGGISEDDKLRSKAQILYSENLDLTTNSDYYTISQEAIVRQVTTDRIVSIFEADGEVFFCDNDRNLYRSGITTPVWTAERVIKTWTTSQYLYLFDTSEDIHRILLSNLGQADWAPYIATTDTTIPSVSGDVFITGSEDKTYLGIGNNVYEINNSTGVVVGTNIFTIDSNVVGLSKLEDNIQIFTESGNYIIRDGISGGSVRTKDLGVKMGYVQNIGSDNYVITGGTVYILNGYKLEQIASNPYSDVLDSLKYSIENMQPGKTTFLEGIFYTGVDGAASNLQTPLAEFEYGDSAIMTYGIKKKGFPLSTNLFISRIEGVRIDSIDYLYAFTQAQNSIGKTLFIGYEDVDGNYGLATISLSDQSGDSVAEDGILIYNTFDGGLKEAQKDLLRIKVRADIFNEGDYIHLCTIDNTGALQWFDGTETNSRVTLSDLSEDGYYYFEPTNSLEFYNFTPAIILENNSNVFRREGIRVYSLTYEYDFTRQR